MKCSIRILFFVTLELLFICSRQGTAATDAPTVAELLPAGAAAGDGFGASIALFHDRLVIGAPGTDLNGADSGAVYVFTRSGSTSWQQEAVLMAGHGTAGDRFGASVAISGDTIVVGVPGADDKGENSGAVFVFVRSGTAWQEQARLAANDGAAGDGFGFAVAIDGDAIAVGAPLDDTKGSAYTFLRSVGTWQQQEKLLAYGGSVAGDRFGCSVAIGYYTIIVGADGDDSKTTDGGSAYVYRANGSGWIYQAKLVPVDSSTGERFGSSVALGLDKALIGVNRSHDVGQARPGAAYVFIRTSGSWAETQRFHGDNEGMDDGFGSAVSLYDNFYLIGAPREAVNGVATGAAYLFSRSETPPWPLHTKYLPQDGAEGDLFGSGVAIFGDTVVGGLPGRESGAASAFMSPCGLGRYLPPSEWEMISQPCSSMSPASILLGDDIEEGIYAKTWIIYYRSPSSVASYLQLGATDPLSLGNGYWIYSVKGGTLKMSGSPTPTINSNECRSVSGCVEIALTWPQSGQQYWYNMVGNPFSHSVNWSDVVVLVTPSDGSQPLAMSPSEAYEKKFMRNSFYRYASNSFTSFNDKTPGKIGVIMPFESIWVHTLDPKNHAFPASAIKLLIPAAGLRKTP